MVYIFTKIQYSVNEFVISGRQEKAMGKKAVQIFIFITLVWSLSSSGVCAVLSGHASKAPCHKHKPFGNGIGVPQHDSCKVLPCSANKVRMFILPDSPSRRIETENRSLSKAPGLAVIPKAPIVLSDVLSVEGIFDLSLFFRAPPIFYLHCVLTC